LPALEARTTQWDDPIGCESRIGTVNYPSVADCAARQSIFSIALAGAGTATIKI